MGVDSKIEWTTHTFNPWRGCTKVSEGCRNCYADAQAKRNPGTLGVWGAQGTRVVASESMWSQPLKWDREAKKAGERRRVFCASMADVFEGPGTMPPESVPEIRKARVRLFNLIGWTPHLDWLLLTKRPQNIRPILSDLLRKWDGTPRTAHVETSLAREVWAGVFGLVNGGRVQSNVWLGTSVENQDAANQRIPHLLNIPAAVHFLSCEPLLGPVDLTRVLAERNYGTYVLNAFTGEGRTHHGEPFTTLPGRVGWGIVGGESGPGARPCNVAWVRDIVRQCKAAGVPCFVKQLGACVTWDGMQGGYGDGPSDIWPRETGTFPDPENGGWRKHLVDKKGGTPDEWPEDLRVREFPNTGART
jgi:protein gp37